MWYLFEKLKFLSLYIVLSSQEHGSSFNICYSLLDINIFWRLSRKLWPKLKNYFVFCIGGDCSHACYKKHPYCEPCGKLDYSWDYLIAELEESAGQWLSSIDHDCNPRSEMIWIFGLEHTVFIHIQYLLKKRFLILWYFGLLICV